MQSGPRLATLEPAARASAGPGPAAPRQRHPDWALILPPAVTLIVMLWGIGAPSYWRDESATLSATARTFPQLLAVLRHFDAVHGLYYLLLWPVVHLAGTGEIDTRMLSALAMAAAALGISAIGRWIRSRRTGLYAGLVFACLPMVSVRGHDARPYGLETAAAVLASYLLLRMAEKPSPRRLAHYGLALVLLGYLHLFGLLIIPAHACALLPASSVARVRRVKDGAGTEGGYFCGAGDMMFRWLVTVAASAAVVAPLAVLGWQQRAQIGWLSRPGRQAVRSLIVSLGAGSAVSVMVIAALIALGMVRADRPDRFQRFAFWRPPALSADRHPLAAWSGRPDQALAWLAVPWLVVPPLLLLVASQYLPVYQFMYVEFCLPAVALLAGAGLAALGWPGRLVAMCLVAVLAMPAQLAIRGPFAGGSLRGAAKILAQHERPGDCVYYPGPRVPTWNIAYPRGFSALRDIGQAQTPVQADLLSGIPAQARVIMQRLRTVHRLWVIEMANRWFRPLITVTPRFMLVHAYRTGAMLLRLYVRAPAQPRAPATRR